MTFSTCGPKITPTVSIPIIRGSFTNRHTAAAASPARKMYAKDVNIKIPPKIRKKLMLSAIEITEVIS